MKVSHAFVAGSCGLGLSYDFGYGYDSHTAKSGGGAGYHMAAFIEGDSKCDEMYKLYKERWPIVFQSEVRLNRNSGNQFYFCVYDVRAANESYAGYTSDDDYYSENNEEDNDDF